jgi:hypothetical protein
MSLELKIKAKHLGLEAGVIRHEERKLKKQIVWANQRQKTDQAFSISLALASISNHRKIVVRNECRATQLARAVIAGVPYETVERKRRVNTDSVFRSRILPRVAAMVAKYRDYKRFSLVPVFQGQNTQYTYDYSHQLLTEIEKWCNITK